MIEKTLRSFCESRRRWLIVIAGTFVVGLVLLVPLADLYFAERGEKTGLLAELASAQEVVETIGKSEADLAAKTAELKTYEARSVDEQSLAALRTRLVELARDTGCSLRRLNVGAGSTRPWHGVNESTAINDVKPSKATEAATGFNLEWRPVTVSVSGTNANLCSLLERMEADHMLMHTKTFEMRPDNEGHKNLNLDMELWYYNLARGA
jgi:hypothetical protein